jgi:hypothetical protein
MHCGALTVVDFPSVIPTNLLSESTLLNESFCRNRREMREQSGTSNVLSVVGAARVSLRCATAAAWSRHSRRFVVGIDVDPALLEGLLARVERAFVA